MAGILNIYNNGSKPIRVAQSVIICVNTTDMRGSLRANVMNKMLDDGFDKTLFESSVWDLRHSCVLVIL